MPDHLNQTKKPSDEKPRALVQVHAGHRERLRNKVIQNGFDHLYDHELLELLLFYCIPRQDTNPIAHELIERFGSLQGVLNADIEAITECRGMSNSSALLIKSLRECSIRYMRRQENVLRYYDTYEKVLDYLRNAVFLGATKEISAALLFDHRMKLLDLVPLGEGSLNATTVNYYKLTEAIILKKAKVVILTHNHMSENGTPSQEDIAVTWEIYTLLKKLDVSLIEHVIVASNGFGFPIMHYSPDFNVEEDYEKIFGEEFHRRFFEPPKKRENLNER